jgi:mannose-1-phosphate guanylyltransferase
MKVFLLSAGIGQRLRPITNNVPKCLVSINNIPLIEYWFRLFRKYGIKDILINTHYLSEKINNYIHNNIKDLNIEMKYEHNLLGSLGTILNNKDFISKDFSFLVFYSDNITNLNINKFILFHESHDFPITMGLFHCSNPSQCGIASVDENNIIINFEEKPKNPTGNLANAGVYVIEREIFNDFKFNKSDLLDIGKHLLPKLVGQMKGFLINDYILDIGSLENYKKANAYVALNQKMFI